MALSIPSTLKLAQLRTLALHCGIASSGTKPVLTQRLIDDINSAPALQSPARVLSIDMGIRNLAYCVLDLPSTAARPSVLAWKRLALSKPTLGESASKESFHPSVLAAHAYPLLRTQLLPLAPTHVLIEQQRFRSSSSSAILEWTLRVNTLEAILYGVLHTLAAEKLWNGRVVPITPSRVGPFWVGDGAADDQIDPGQKRRNAKSAKARNKGAKIDLVKAWLEQDSNASFAAGQAEGMAKAYLEKWYGKPRRKSTTLSMAGDQEMGKLDDLADSLLQGMAWIQWQRNKQLLREKGIEAMFLSPSQDSQTYTPVASL